MCIRDRACVGRGGTYMLNIGPRGDGSVPQRAVDSLKAAGDWIKRYPQVVYAAGPSPWEHAMPWGDVTSKENDLFLSVFAWPTSRKLSIPGLKNPSNVSSTSQWRRRNSYRVHDQRGLDGTEATSAGSRKTRLCHSAFICYQASGRFDLGYRSGMRNRNCG